MKRVTINRITVHAALYAAGLAALPAMTMAADDAAAQCDLQPGRYEGVTVPAAVAGLCNLPERPLRRAGDATDVLSRGRSGRLHRPATAAGTVTPS